MYYEKDGRGRKKKASPIVSIYFLGHRLEHTESPLIRIDRKYHDMTTKEEIKEKEEFIESLTHDGFVIQIPYLKEGRRSDLDKLLSVFDQGDRADSQILNVREEDYPEKYGEVVRRLQRAMSEPDIKR